MSKDTYVKPYKRKNKKRSGEHTVSGHTRNIKKRHVEKPRDVFVGGSDVNEELAEDVEMWHRFRVRKDPDKEIKKHESGATVFLSGGFFAIRPSEVYDLNAEKYHTWSRIHEKYENMDRKFERAIYEYDGNYFIIYDNNIWGVEKNEGEFGRNYYKVQSHIRALEPDDVDVNLDLLERDNE